MKAHGGSGSMAWDGRGKGSRWDMGRWNGKQINGAGDIIGLREREKRLIKQYGIGK